MQRGAKCRAAGSSGAAAASSDTPADTYVEPDFLRTAAFLDLTQIDGVLFDVDGTLTHSDDLHFQAFQELLLDKGYGDGELIDRPFFNANIAGRHNPDIAADLFPDWTHAQHEAFSDEKEAYFRQLAKGKLKPIPGLPALIDALNAANIRQVAVTNSTPDNVRLMLQEIGLADSFEAVVFGANCARAKPHPDPYLVGLRKLSLEGSPEKALIFEDSPAGVRAGVAAGVRTIAIATTQPPGVLAGLGASDVIPDYQNILL